MSISNVFSAFTYKDMKTRKWIFVHVKQPIEESCMCSAEFTYRPTASGQGVLEKNMTRSFSSIAEKH